MTPEDLLAASDAFPQLRVRTLGALAVEPCELVEAVLGCPSLPEDLATFYRSCGAADIGPIRLLGPTSPPGSPHDVVVASLAERADDDPPLVVLERLPGGCAVYAHHPEDGGWRIERRVAGGGSTAIGGGLRDYLRRRIDDENRRFLAATEAVNRAVDEGREQREINERGVPAAPLSRHQARVARYCIQNEILAVWVVRYSRSRRSTVVTALVADTLDGQPLHAGAMAALTTLCVEARGAGGEMCLDFEAGIPTVVLRAAEDYGLDLGGRERISGDEVNGLLVASAQLGPVIERLELPPEIAGAVAVSVLQGAWSRAELSFVASLPDLAPTLLLGGPGHADALTRLRDVDVVASAILGGMAIRALLSADPEGEREDAVREAEIMPSLATPGAVVLRAHEDLPQPPGWQLLGTFPRRAVVGAGEVITLAARAVPDPSVISRDGSDPGEVVLLTTVDTEPPPSSVSLVAPVSRAQLLSEAGLRLRRMRQVTS